MFPIISGSGCLRRRLGGVGKSIFFFSSFNLIFFLIWVFVLDGFWTWVFKEAAWGVGMLILTSFNLIFVIWVFGFYGFWMFFEGGGMGRREIAAPEAREFDWVLL